ncbi:hypothetical protein [Actinoplanes sp. N902-109]|uniref:hypothetical protein n=1 Tax=Actinoplanes sp. (strain N902-109) TaxID=649831 RepID=UPI0012FCCA7A|nr:hypothetical protein [Actinoplanes sp. N902-109]
MRFKVVLPYGLILLRAVGAGEPVARVGGGRSRCRDQVLWRPWFVDAPLTAA